MIVKGHSEKTVDLTRKDQPRKFLNIQLQKMYTFTPKQTFNPSLQQWDVQALSRKKKVCSDVY